MRGLFWRRVWLGYLGVAACTVVLAGGWLAAQTPDRSRPPDPGPTPSFSFPPIQTLQLSNGLPVLLLEKHEVPLVQVNVLVRAGSAQDPKDLNGLASTVADMVDEGAGSRSALELSDAIEYLGASISTRSDYHVTSVALHTPRSRLETAVSLLADIVLQPTFAESELDRLRKEGLTELLQAHDEPRAVAAIAFNRALYGADHPYGTPKDLETPIRAVTTAHLTQFHSTYYRPNNAAVIVVGDVIEDDLVPLLERAFGSWEKAEIAGSAWSAPAPVRERWLLLVDKPGAAQSEVRIGSVGVQRNTNDYYALTVMNTILGGSFSSRLNQNLREEHGYAYGAFSSFAFRLHPGPFLAASSVQTDVTDKALQEFIKELNGIRVEVSDEELERAKNFVALQFPQRFEGVAQVAAQLAQAYEHHLSMDYFDTFISRILDVRKEDVTRVAQKYLNPDRMVVVIVGDLAKTGEGIRALDLGPVTWRSVVEVLGPPPRLGTGQP